MMRRLTQDGRRFVSSTAGRGGVSGVTSLLKEERVFEPPASFAHDSHIQSLAQYERMWEESIRRPDKFWGSIAAKFQWAKPWAAVCETDFHTAAIRWFRQGALNVSVNLLDRHVAAGHGGRPCLSFVADGGEQYDDSRTLTYRETLEEVSKMGTLLRDQGVKKGDRVTVYMPMVPQLAVTVLACARIGAIHSVVFGGFSAEAIADRIVDCKSDVVVTADAGVRGGRVFPLKPVVDRAVDLAAARGTDVRRVLVTHRAGTGVGPGSEGWQDGRDVDLDAGMNKLPAATECRPEVMDSEDPLFILYTSGSTGKPKGVLHTCAGYLLYAATTFKYVFDIKPENDVHFCTADIGWITGHSYLLYGPLANGAHSVMFEGIPTWPEPSRLWEICANLGVTTFYTAPTALRSLMVHSDEHVTKNDLSSLRLLGTVGEPINPEAWMWYHNVVGGGRLPIVDTWWQTETGGILLTPLPGATPLKPGSCTLPFFGSNPKILRADGSDCEIDEGGHLCMAEPGWPGMMRSVYGDHDRFRSAYFKDHPGKYFSGDMARRDEDGYLWILGRADDVMNVSGHRIGSAEVESALVKHEAVCEAATVSMPHPIKGEAIYCFVTLEEGRSAESGELAIELRQTVRESIGAIASPEELHFTQVLPKTRSGKIMRRILRKVASRDTSDLGDVSTLADPSVVETLIATRDDTQ